MNFVKLLSQQTDLICGQGVTQIEIEDAETKLNLKFASEYREYLKACSSAIANGHELTGLCKQMNVISVTIDEWEFNPKIPRTMYVVERADIDGIIIWQTEEGSVYLSQPGRDPIKIASSLVEYFMLE